MRALAVVALRALWFVAVPLVLSALLVRYAFPVRLGRDHVLLVAVGSFFALASLVRYWRRALPGGRFLSALPPALAVRVPARRVRSVEAAWRLTRWLGGGAGRRFLAASSEGRARYEELASALQRGKWSRIDALAPHLAELCRAPLRVSANKQSMTFGILLLGSAALAFELRAHFLQVYEVHGSSMLPTLAPAQLVLGKPARFSAEHLPRRGQLVVVHATVDGAPVELIKRVLGLPGDHIAVQSGFPTINGWPLPSCDVGAYYAPHEEKARDVEPGGRAIMEFVDGAAYLTYRTKFAAPMPEYVVKPGEIFVLGDNRASSRDSRNLEQGAPRGLPLSAVRAEVTRSLLGLTRRGELDFSSAFSPIGGVLHEEGMDTSQLEAGAQYCLTIRPALASPPAKPSLALAGSTP